MQINKPEPLLHSKKKKKKKNNNGSFNYDMSTPQWVSGWCISTCVTCCMSESCPLTNPSLLAHPSPPTPDFFPSVKCSAFDLLLHISLSCLGAQSSQKTDSLGSYSIPLCKAGCRHTCSMPLLLEFTSEVVNSPSPGWGPAGLGGSVPHIGVSQVRCRLWGVESYQRTGREEDCEWVPSST